MGRFEEWGAKALGHAGYWTSAAVIVAMGWTLHNVAQSIDRTSRSVGHTLEALEGIAAVGAAVSRAEAAQRGFVINPAPRHIAERDAAISGAHRIIARLLEATADNALQTERLSRLAQLIEGRAGLMRQTEKLRITQGPEAVAKRPSGKGQALSAEIHALTGELREEELRLLDLRRGEQEAERIAANRTLVAGVVLVLLVLVPAYLGFAFQGRARRKAERRLAEVAENLPGAVFQYRTFPDGKYRYEYLSEGARRLRGIDPGRALHDPSVVIDTIVEEDRPGVFARIAAAEESLSPFEHDYRARMPDGEVRWFRTSAKPRRSRDGSLLWSGHWADVTERKAMQRALVESKEAAEAASRAKSIFLATMSHEIRTPMNGVIGMLELLAMTELTAEQRTSLQVVRESGRSLLRIIDDILDFSKIEAGRMDLRPAPTAIAEVVERVHNVFAGNASSKGLLLTHHVDPSIAQVLLLDGQRLQQILNNLVSNAIKFTQQGEVHIRAELVQHRGSAQRVRIAVSDTGVGISAEDQARLFTPFVQVGAPGQGGSGLGLSISRRLAELMGGDIAVDSKAGAGTSMVLHIEAAVGEQGMLPVPAFPYRPLPAEPARPAPPAAEAEAEGTLVLVADDHPINRMVLKRQVNALGYAVETAADGLDALDLWSTGRFAALVTDCNMPEMDGYQLARHIRECERRNGLRRTVIVACTANALGGETENCLAAGMDDYIAKPVELGQLAAKLGQWLPLPEPVDRSVLAETISPDERQQHEYLERFGEYNRDDVRALTSAVGRGDLEHAAQLAHRIKGAARTVGATAFAGAAEEIERAARTREAERVAGAMERFELELARLARYLERC